ncbi:hypothetical protein STVA_32420 [Allostella vacuolata]|nr:hypothetical protein STVA_32420 [Stella vacuolata]
MIASPTAVSVHCGPAAFFLLVNPLRAMTALPDGDSGWRECYAPRSGGAMDVDPGDGVMVECPTAEQTLEEPPR